MHDQSRNVFLGRGVVTHIERERVTRRGNVVATVAYDMSDFGHECEHSALVMYGGKFTEPARALNIGDVCEFQFCVAGFYDGPGTQATCMLCGGMVTVLHRAAEFAENEKRAEVDELLKDIGSGK